MAIRRKAQETVDQSIEVDSTLAAEPSKVKATSLRLPAELAADLDWCRSQYRRKPSMHAYILEAIEEKIERDRVRFSETK